MSAETSPTDRPPGLRPLDLAGLAAVATVARTFNLGTFSLWMDEVFIMLRAQGSPAAVWAACRANAEHPPLSALVMWALSSFGASETVHRLLTIALGIGTVLLLASWAGRRFGRAAGLATGLVAALLPFHVRYSQELRPYVYLLFFAALTLAAAERLETRPGPGAAALAFAALLGGFYSHHLFVLVLLPAAWPMAEMALSREPGQRRAGRRALGFFLAAAGAAFLAFLPWFFAVTGELASRPPGGRVVTWNLGRALIRWQFLTVGGMEGERLTWAAALALGLALVGAVAALRYRAGRAAVAGAIVGIVGVEAFYLAVDHWTRGRYNAMGWLFLPVLIGLGIARIGAFRSTRPLAAALLAALLLGELAGLARYARVGRADWDRVADAVRQIRRPGETVLTENAWTRISLAYYLQGRDFPRRTREDGAPVAVEDGPHRLRQLWPADRPALLVISSQPRYRQLRRWAQAFPVVARFPRSDARIYFLAPETRQRLFASGIKAAGPAAAGAPPAGGRALPRADPPRRASWLERLGRGRW
jgi:4-amino-4-deoxy-L-arabinose transferase-like glycosyltransferase